jgi:tryptophan-rich sensory protein
MSNRINVWFGLALSILLCFGIAAIGSYFTSSSVDSWYPSLIKPSWRPPNWLFAPVWTALYLSMAISAWLVWRQSGYKKAASALTFFLLQLILNAAWSGLFFGLRQPFFAFLEIILLWLAILVTIRLFFRLRPVAAWMMVPYLLWVTFAAVLNLSIWWLNAA